MEEEDGVGTMTLVMGRCVVQPMRAGLCLAARKSMAEIS